MNASREQGSSPAALRHRRSLQRQLFTLMGVLLVTVLILVGGCIYLFISQTERSAWQGRQVEAAQNAAEIVSAFLQRVEDTLAVAGALNDKQLKQSSEPLRASLERNPALLELIRINEHGEVVANASRGTPVLANLFSIPQSNWFRRAINGERYLGELQIATDDEPYLIIALPAADGGAVAGRLRMNMLWEVVSAIRFGKTGGAYVVNRRGEVVADADPEVVLSRTHISNEQAQLTGSRPEMVQHEYTNFRGVPVLGVSVLIPRTDWRLFAEIPETEAGAISRISLLVVVGGVMLFGAIIIGAIALLMRRLIFRQMDLLRGGAKRIGDGDLEHRIPVRRHDEIGQVATAFNTMAESLRTRDLHIAEQTTMLRAEIAERQRTEEALIHAKEAAEVASQAKSTFLATMSHELRTPLTGILGYSDLIHFMVSNGDYSNVLHDLDRIRSAGRHLLALINDILDLSKIEAGKMSTRLEIVDIAALMGDVADTARPLMTKNMNRFEVRCPPGIGTMRTDAMKLRQVLLNLLSNAAKFTEQGSVTLTVERDQIVDSGWVSFHIADTGIGIPDEKMQRLFKPFSQVDDSPTRKYGGTGLGLALSQWLCQMLGGTITVSSAVGQGSTFSVLLPTTVQSNDDPDASLLATNNPEPPGDASNSRVPPIDASFGMIALMIDCDQERCELAAELLAAEQFVLVSAVDAELGLSMARDLRPDLIIVGFGLPDMSVDDVLAELKADSDLIDTPVILLVDIQKDDVGAPASSKPAQPLDAGRLLAAVRASIGLNRASA